MWIQEEQKMADKETEQIKKLNQTVHSKDTRERDQAYNEYVKQVTPTHNLIFHMVKGIFYRWDHLLYWAVHFKYVSKIMDWTKTPPEAGVSMLHDPAQRDPDGI